MTVTLECPCGARLTIEDGSELATVSVMNAWQSDHNPPHGGILDSPEQPT